MGHPVARGAIRAAPARQPTLIGTECNVAGHLRGIAVPAVAVAVAELPVLAGAHSER